MIQIPAGIKFHGVAASVDTRDKKSASRNALHEAFSIEDIQLSANNFDFTDTLSYITEEDYDFNFGQQFIAGVGLLTVNFEGDSIGALFSNDDAQILSTVSEGTASLSGIASFPSKVVGKILEVKSGDLTGSFAKDVIAINDLTPVGGSLGYDLLRSVEWIDPLTDEFCSINLQLAFDESRAFSALGKVNDSGESINLTLFDDETGFKISNDLSDDTASVLRIEDNNGDAILEFLNDYLVSETIPALDYADDAAAALGGVPVGGIYHNSGTIKIRLT